MADNDDQHDFDDFDGLTTDPESSPEMDDDLSFGKPDSGRKKRQAVFYLVLVIILALAGTSAWFLFLRHPEGSQTAMNATAPMPVVAETETTPPPANPLPPGVVSAPDASKPEMPSLAGNPNAPAMPGTTPPSVTATTPAPGTPTGPNGTTNIVPVDPNAVNPEVATPQVASPEVAAVENKAPAAATVSSTGMTAEALPPPIATGADKAATPGLTPTPAPTAGTTTPSLTPEPTTPANAPAMKEAASATPSVATTTPALPEATPSVATPVAPVSANEPAIKPTTPATAAITPTAPVAPAGPSAAEVENTALKDQVKELNEKLEIMNHQMEAMEQQAASTPKTVSTTSTTEEVKAKPAKKKAATKKAAKKSETSEKSSEKSSSGKSASWELRSAQPGVAWLGKLNSEEMVRYAIGQNVPGLGTVQDVTQEGGRWIVKTTGGTLRQ